MCYRKESNESSLDSFVLELKIFVIFNFSMKKRQKTTNEIEDEYKVMMWNNDNKIKNKENVTKSKWLI